MVRKAIVQEIEKQQLPGYYLSDVERYFQPLAGKIAAMKKHHKGALVVGIQGGQGTGKSTLALFLSLILKESDQFNCITLSLDDFYLCKQQRVELSTTIHPLLKTRGVPGTHDVALARRTITQLKRLAENQSLALPRFDKAQDDRKPESEWGAAIGPVDIIFFEGWCVAATPQSDESLSEPINKLEAEEDSSGVWRRWVNEQLGVAYKALFDQIDYLIMLQAPSFDVIFEWRLLQEEKLKARYVDGSEVPPSIMSAGEIARFIQHYERITRHSLAELTKRADCLLQLRRDHRINFMTDHHR